MQKQHLSKRSLMDVVRIIVLFPLVLPISIVSTPVRWTTRHFGEAAGFCLFIALMWLGFVGYLRMIGVRSLLLPASTGVIALVLILIMLVLAFLDANRKGSGGGEAILSGERIGWTPKEELHPELAKLRAWMKRLSERSFLFVEPKTPRFSKLRGAPDLPAELNWPVGKAGPLDFLLQVELSELKLDKGPDWLPAEGRLYAFYDQGGDGDWDGVKVLYSTAEPQPLTPEDHRGGQPIGFHTFRSAPSAEWLGLDHRELPSGGATIEMQDQAAGATQPSFGGVTHRIGGFPNEIQEECMRLTCELEARSLPGRRYREPDYRKPIPPEIDKASQDWRMLLQIDSDDEWSWGDGGMLYVFVRREDAKRGDFSKTITVGQCY